MVQAPELGRGWKAYLTVDEDEPVEAVVYCAECSDREFGETAEPLTRRLFDTAFAPRSVACVG
jgi:hypothetical protein